MDHELYDALLNGYQEVEVAPPCGEAKLTEPAQPSVFLSPTPGPLNGVCPIAPSAGGPRVRAPGVGWARRDGGCIAKIGAQQMSCWGRWVGLNAGVRALSSSCLG